LPGAYAQVCIYAASGTYVCLNPSEADEEGVFEIDVPEFVRCVDSVAMRASLPNSPRAVVYCPFAPGDEPVTRLEDPIVLPSVPPSSGERPLRPWRRARRAARGSGVSALPPAYCRAPRNVQKGNASGGAPRRPPARSVALHPPLWLRGLRQARRPPHSRRHGG